MKQLKSVSWVPQSIVPAGKSTSVLTNVLLIPTANATAYLLDRLTETKLSLLPTVICQKGVRFAQAVGSENHSLSIASRKNHARDGYQIENLPWGSGKGICLWRQGKTCPAQAVHALSNETGMLIREDEKPPPF